MTVPTEKTELDPVVRIVEAIKRHRRPLIIAAAAVAVAVAAVMYIRMAAERRENFAANLLTEARTVAASGNVALAITDLADLANSYRGTMAAEEAEILLARLRISEDQTQAAAQSLQEYLDQGPSDQFRAPAYGLLAVALEQSGDLAEAAAAYEDAAEAAWYDFLRVQYLLDAGRVLTTMGDTSQAVAKYQRILDAHSEIDMVAEARLRLGELLGSDIDAR